MSPPVLSDRSLGAVVVESSIFLVMNIIGIVGNVLVCLAVYKNPKLRSSTNLYVVALAVSDLLCATMLMPFASAVSITGRWIFGDAFCQLEGFVQVFVLYSTPGTIGLLAFNRYIRIVKTSHYNKIFSPRRSKVWLSCVWLSLALYLLIGGVTNWSTFEFNPRYADCSVAFNTTEKKIIHFCVVFGLFFLLSFSIGLFSYYKIFLKTRQHQVNVAPSLQNSRNQAGRISVQEINMSRTLAYVAGGFLICWVPMWGLIFWKRFSPDTAPRIVQLTVLFLLYLSSTINPFIYAARNRVFREEFRKLLCWWKERRITTEADSGANRKRGRGKKTTETAISSPESTSVFFPPGDGKDKDHRNPENEVAERDP